MTGFLPSPSKPARNCWKGNHTPVSYTHLKHVLPERPNWYPCACCPPNVARLVSSIGQYAWGENESTVFAHTYLGGKATFQNGAVISCESSYPWSGSVKFTMEADKEFTFALHIPSWCKSWSLNVSGNGIQPELRGGYAYLSRAWKAGDTVELTLKLEPRRIYANTNVRADAGCVALARGPIVYCFEEKDNGAKLSSLRVPRSAAISEEICGEEKLAGMVALTLTGMRMTSGSSLYLSLIHIWGKELKACLSNRKTQPRRRRWAGTAGTALRPM